MCEKVRKVYLIGTGMGAADSFTREAQETAAECDCIIGAERMLRLFGESGKPCLKAYQTEVILEYIYAHPEYRKIAVLLSGDVGFYSGAKRLEEKLAEHPEEKLQVTRVPGISSLVYLAAALHMSWEDIKIVSLHGRTQNYIYEIQRNEKTFLLLGDQKQAGEVVQKLNYYGFSGCTIHIGCNLSYPEERIVTKQIAQLQEADLTGLCAAIVINEKRSVRVAEHLRDAWFERGRVPMTKEEVRAVCIARLQLTQEAVLYDVGAGTGSVSIEAALRSGQMRIYAIEKNPEGIRLIRENCKKFAVDHVQIVEGTAPEALADLEAPTHVFIGGSSGNLREIIHCVKAKNPHVRIVMTSISLNTMAEVSAAVENGELYEPEIVQLSVAKAKRAGHHHMMMGQNPVYVISEGER